MYPLTPPPATELCKIIADNGPLTLSELVGHCGTTARRLLPLLARLEADGEIQRLEAPKNRVLYAAGEDG